MMDSENWQRFCIYSSLTCFGRLDLTDSKMSAATSCPSKRLRKAQFFAQFATSLEMLQSADVCQVAGLFLDENLPNLIFFLSNFFVVLKNSL